MQSFRERRGLAHFLRRVARAGVLLALACLLVAVAAAQSPKSTVVLVERPAAVEKFTVNDAMVKDMFNTAILKLTGQPTVAGAWREGIGINAKDVVGIKITTAGGPVLATQRGLVNAIAQGLVAAGVPAGNIIVWDKLEEDMKRANYAPAGSGGKYVNIRCILPQTSYDPAVYYVNEVVGKLIWGDLMFVGKKRLLDAESIQRATDAANRRAARKAGEIVPDEPAGAKDNDTDRAEQTSNKSYFAKLITQTCTKIINVPALTDNNLVGMSGCISSLALGSVDNTRRFQGDANNFGDPSLAEILDKDFMKKKVVLHVLDALIAQYAGGPAFNPIYSPSPGAIYVSRDPVAIDTLALARMEAWRAEAKIAPMGETAAHVKGAANAGLGEGDVTRIPLITLP